MKASLPTVEVGNYSQDQLNSGVNLQLRGASDPESHVTARVDSLISALRIIEMYGKAQEPPLSPEQSANRLTSANAVVLNALLTNARLHTVGTSNNNIRDTARAVHDALQPTGAPKRFDRQIVSS